MLNLQSKRPFVIAGPCSAESREQLMSCAKKLSENPKVDVFRAGIWKPRTRPDSFEGVGREGLMWLREVKRETGLPVSTEVANASHVNDALKFGVDMLWIGARTSANPFAMQEIADALRGVETPIFIKNPVSPDLNLWIGAIERVVKAGVPLVGAIHRGFSTYKNVKYRNMPMWQIALDLQVELPDVPLICDPSHMGGSRDYIQELAQRSADLNYNGLMIETHVDPGSALSDREQQVTPEELDRILSNLVTRTHDSHGDPRDFKLDDLRSQIDLFDIELMDILEKRMDVASSIGEYKRERNLTIFQSSRWEAIIEKACHSGEMRGLSCDFIKQLFKAIHQESINHQNRVMNRI